MMMVTECRDPRGPASFPAISPHRRRGILSSSPVSTYPLAAFTTRLTYFTYANLSLKVRGAGRIPGPEPAG